MTGWLTNVVYVDHIWIKFSNLKKSWSRNLIYKSPAYLDFGFQFVLERIKAWLEFDLEKTVKCYSLTRSHSSPVPTKPALLRLILSSSQVSRSFCWLQTPFLPVIPFSSMASSASLLPAPHVISFFLPVSDELSLSLGSSLPNLSFF